MRTLSTSLWVLLLTMALVAILLTFSGCQRSLPEIKATMLLEFGKFLPPERELFLIENAGNLYALGFRTESEGPYAVRTYQDQLYSVTRSLKLDLYLPQEATAPLPVVMLVHGGGWQYFSKVAPSGFGKLLASHGMAAVSVDYRPSSEAKWPAQLHDLVAAQQWLQQHAPVFGLDMKRFALLGDSAGAHLAAMLALAADEQGLEKPDAVVGYYGVYDLAPLVASAPAEAERNPIYMLLGVPSNEIIDVARSASPLYYVDGQAPAFLLIHGLGDSLVPTSQTEAMAARLQEAGAEVKTLFIAEADHLLLQILDSSKPALTEVDAEVISFLSRHLQKRN